mgnify:FL=1
MSKVKEKRTPKLISKFKETKFAKKADKVWNSKVLGNPWVRLGLLALLLNFVNECLSRHSFIKGIIYFGSHPLAFLFNSFMIFFTLSIAMLFKKRVFATFFISAVWFGLGVTNFVIRSSRKSPFAASDFRNLTEGLKVIQKYYTVPQIVILCLVIAALVACIIFIAIRTPKVKQKINYLLSALVIAVSFGMIMIINYVSNATGLIPRQFGNLVRAYDTYGFGYMFSCSLFRNGVSKPKDYSPGKVNDVVDSVDNNDKNNNDTDKDDIDKPNIIFLQLESFFDATNVKGLEFSEDPIPNMRKLYEKFPGGYLSVPSFGAGTANTEFETMTGMNLDDFGPGEYPYKTVLQSTACESICYYLSNYGYTATALHDNTGGFYDRNRVFSRLGFNSFVSIEYIEKYEMNPIGWVKDKCLTDEIVGILDSTSTPDYIYTISVQGHGDYPENTDGLDLPVKVTNNNVTGNPNGFEYYVNQTHEMDAFVAELIDALSKRNEKTILVIYGDHLPTFDITDDDLKNGDIYQTQYVVWNNYNLQIENKDLQAYQLSAYLMKNLGMKGGVISKLHMSHFDKEDKEDKEEYLSNLKLLEYDILYGNCQAYEGVNPYKITNMKMGYKPIKVLNGENAYSHIVIRGRNFTEFSQVEINGTVHKTIYNGPDELLVDGYTLKDGDQIAVLQISNSDETLSRTNIFTYKESDKLSDNN